MAFLTPLIFQSLVYCIYENFNQKDTDFTFNKWFLNF